MANLSSVARSAYSDLLRLLKDDMITNVRGSLMTTEHRDALKRALNILINGV